MAPHCDLIVYQDVYTRISRIFEYTKEFSGEQKYTLGQDIKRDWIVLVRAIYRANKAKEKRRSTHRRSWQRGGKCLCERRKRADPRDA
jgi:hypothetical protein